MSVIGGARKSIRDIQTGNLAFTSAGWSMAGDATSVVTLLDRSGGGFSFETDATDNDSSALVYGGEAFKFSAGARGSLRAEVKWVPAGADTGNMFIGFSDTAVDFFADADTIVSGDHLGFWINTGSAFWRTLSQVTATNLGETTTTAATSGTIYKLRMEYECLTDGITSRFYVDDVLVDTITGQTYSSFGPELQLMVVVANKGGNANVLSLYEVDAHHRNVA